METLEELNKLMKDIDKEIEALKDKQAVVQSKIDALASSTSSSYVGRILVIPSNDFVRYIKVSAFNKKPEHIMFHGVLVTLFKNRNAEIKTNSFLGLYKSELHLMGEISEEDFQGVISDAYTLINESSKAISTIAK